MASPALPPPHPPPSCVLQVGLIVYMAHIGSFVPAQRAVVGLTDRILTRIITQDQLAARQSSFMADLLQVGGVRQGNFMAGLLRMCAFVGVWVCPCAGVSWQHGRGASWQTCCRCVGGVPVLLVAAHMYCDAHISCRLPDGFQLGVQLSTFWLMLDRPLSHIKRQSTHPDPLSPRSPPACARPPAAPWSS
jgi:hypothetical protein